jgi:hypothetical protein
MRRKLLESATLITLGLALPAMAEEQRESLDDQTGVAVTI